MANLKNLQGRLTDNWSGTWTAALDLVLPPLCLACNEPVSQNGVLCAACWEGVDFLGPPWCDVCGFPFAYDQGPGAICGPCAAQPPPYDRARAVMRYDDNSKGLIMAFKHADRIDQTGPFAAWLGRVGREMIEEAEAILPVPLHWRRLLARRYNQSALLAQAIATERPGVYLPDVLQRRRATPSQGRLTAPQRRANVAGAFAVKADKRHLIADKSVLLVDDVMTTGATVEACTNALLRAGAARVQVLVLARVFRGGG